MSMWEPFREEGRRTIVAAQQAAQELGHAFIAPEHLLVGIATEWRTAAAQALSESGATYEKLLDRLRIAMPAETSKPPDEMAFTDRARRVIELAFEEARGLQNNYIGAEHLLLGIAREAEGRADSILAAFGTGYGALFEKLHAQMPANIPANKGAFAAFDHVQLAMPAGQEERARAFYGGILGMDELQQPPELAARGGAWFSCGQVQLHLGVEHDFRPATKAHPALRCRDYPSLLKSLRESGCEVSEAEPLPDGRPRSFISDPFGNRIELTG